MVTTKDEIIKGEILSAAQKLFQQFGIRKTTMEDIAKNISKGKSTLYYYYCSKEEIFEAVVKKEMDEVFDLIRQAVEAACTAEEKLLTYAVTKMQTLRQMSNLYQMVKLDISENPPCYHHLHREFEQREIQLVANILQHGIATGEFNQKVAGGLNVVPFVIISSLKGFVLDLFTDNRFEKMEDSMNLLTGLLLNGLKNK